MKMDSAMAIEAAALSKQQRMLDAMAQGESDVQRFYKNSVVFVTGGSGFLGKQLIEKLLRSCQISKIYVLLRSKNGKKNQERIQEMIKDPVFDTLHQQQPKFYEKINAIEGDITEVKLGIKDDDWKILTEKVDVIFHVAATTRFDENLRTATMINVRGTREALLLGKACLKLRSYVHVSTAYSHTTKQLIGGEVLEEFYNTPVPPDVMISMAENLELERLNNITKEFIEGWPNTYTFTKAIAEELVRSSSVGLPICIVRPAIVMGTYLEPSPGWLDKSCLYGVSGLILGSGLGVIHTLLLDNEIKMGLIPCDYVNNAIIIAAREAATNQAKGGKDTKIYTVCSTNRNPVSFKMITDTLIKEKPKLVSPHVVYYIFTFATASKIWFKILSIFLHIVPAYIADFVCLLMGKQRRFAKLAKKVYSVFSVISYFSTNEWNFLDHNLTKLFSGLSKQDQAIFNCDVTNIDWNEFALILAIGLRKYILKDGLKDTEYGVKKEKFLKYVHYVFTTLYVYCIWKVMSLIVFLTSSIFRK